jgi:hypothetical protein
MQRYISAALAVALALALGSPRASAAPNYFHMHLRANDRFENVFSRSVSSPVRARVSAGFGTYHVRDVRGGTVDFDGTYGMYGRQSGTYAGGMQQRSDAFYWIAGGKTREDTDASGPAFNPWIWGSPPSAIAAGTTWTVRIPKPWESGPPGTQTVRVLSIDPANDRIVLQRTGSGSGAPRDEKLTPIGGVMPSFGTSTWSGVAVVRRGLIESDALVVRRQIIVPSSKTRPRHTITEIEQVELQLVPQTNAFGP